MTYSDLLLIWDARDRLYEYRFKPLTSSQERAVRDWREKEAHGVPGPESKIAMEKARKWQPPVSKTARFGTE
jgi:hypothetical protein